MTLVSSNYSSFKESIGYDPRSVVKVMLPSNTVRHTMCTRICNKADGHKGSTCEHCYSLKHYLSTQKRTHSDDSHLHSEHQQSSSTFPFEYLSPASKKAKLTNVRKDNKRLKVKLERLKDCKDRSSIELNNEQSNEVVELVNTISSSEAGKSELEKI